MKKILSKPNKKQKRLKRGKEWFPNGTLFQNWVNHEDGTFSCKLIKTTGGQKYHKWKQNSDGSMQCKMLIDSKGENRKIEKIGNQY